MTRIADFRALARPNSHEYLIYDFGKQGFDLINEAQWKITAPEGAGNTARHDFLDAIRREYTDISEAIEELIAPLLKENVKPLKSWHVAEILLRVETLRFDQSLKALHESFANFEVGPPRILFGLGKQTASASWHEAPA